jgi:hypothetical protein
MKPVVHLRNLLTQSVSGFLLLTAAYSASADEVPVLNVDPVCRGIAQQAGDPSEKGGPDLSFSQCVKNEELTRQKLSKEWATFAPADRANCIGESKAGGQASYTDLVTCLELARDARKLNAPGPNIRIEQ